MTKYRWALCGLAVLPGMTAVNAAAPGELPWVPEDPPMQVRIVRSAQPGCEPDCPEWISAQGKIMAGQTLYLFRSALRRLKGRKLPVFLHSSGGAVREALAIGRLIRTNGLDVAVMKTEFAACAAGDAACRKQEAEGRFRGTPWDVAVCGSACTFVLGGGTRRFADQRTQIGVHQPQSFATYSKIRRYYWRETVSPGGRRSKTLFAVVQRNTVPTKTGESQYKEIEQYFTSMGVGGNIMQLTRSAPYWSAHWMTADELTSTQLITSRTSGLELLPGFVPPKGWVPLPPPAGAASSSVSDRRLEGVQTMPQALPSVRPAPADTSVSVSERWLKGMQARPQAIPAFPPAGSPAQKVSPVADGPASAKAVSPPGSSQSAGPEASGTGTVPPQIGPGPATGSDGRAAP